MRPNTTHPHLSIVSGPFRITSRNQTKARMTLSRHSSNSNKLENLIQSNIKEYLFIDKGNIVCVRLHASLPFEEQHTKYS